MSVVLLLGIVLLREPRFAQAEDLFLRWLLDHSEAETHPPVALTVIEIARDSLVEPASAPGTPRLSAPAKRASAAAASPLEFALFLQAVIEFQPGVVAFENIVRWRDRDKDQEQVFLDQAMRVPKLLLASELSNTAELDEPWANILGFAQITGKRGDLATFSGMARQPNEDLRLISTAGFTNLPDEISSGIRVPLLFLYRGEVIPSFALQAIMLWLRITPAEVKIALGSHIELPQGRRIPVDSDGTLLVDPNASFHAHHLTLNELLFAAQQRDRGGTPSPQLTNIRGNLVLARLPDNPLSPPDPFTATIATIQGNKYLRRVSPIFDCAILLVVSASLGAAQRFDRADLVLGGIAFTAVYCLVALALIARFSVWLPALLPLGALWILIVAVVFLSRKTPEIAAASEPLAVPPSVA